MARRVQCSLSSCTDHTYCIRCTAWRNSFVLSAFAPKFWPQPAFWISSTRKRHITIVPSLPFSELHKNHSRSFYYFCKILPSFSLWMSLPIEYNRVTLGSLPSATRKLTKLWHRHLISEFFCIILAPTLYYKPHCLIMTTVKSDRFSSWISDGQTESQGTHFSFPLSIHCHKLL